MKSNTYVAVGLMILSLNASAAGFYVGAAAGLGNVDIEGSSESTNTKSLFGGVMFTKYLGVEAGYVDFGDVSSDTTVSGTPVGISIEAKGVTLAAVGALPLSERFTMTGRLGVNHVKTDLSVSALGITDTMSHTNTKPFAGISGVFKVSNHWSVRASAERYTDVGGGDLGEYDIDVLSVGAVLSF
jgi:OmpA-OmpF porin, OOP family